MKAKVSATSPRRTRLRALFLGVLGAVSLSTLSGCHVTLENITNLGFPHGVTPQAQDMRHFWVLATTVALIVGLLVWFLMSYIIIAHRKKDKDDFPAQTNHSLILEVFNLGVPFIIVALLFIETYRVENKVIATEPNPPVIVDVTAFKWNWKFGYARAKVADIDYYGIVGPNLQQYDPFSGINPITHERDTELPPEKIEQRREQVVRLRQQRNDGVDLAQLRIDRVETIGTTTEVPVLVLPTQTRIEFREASSDVIHSFYVPEFLFKRDVVPFPLANHSKFYFQISKIDREGSFVGRCAEMCGNFHSAMNFEVRAVSPKQFAQYLKNREKGMSNSDALASIGSSPTAVTTKPFNALES